MLHASLQTQDSSKLCLLFFQNLHGTCSFKTMYLCPSKSFRLSFKKTKKQRQIQVRKTFMPPCLVLSIHRSEGRIHAKVWLPLEMWACKFPQWPAPIKLQETVRDLNKPHFSKIVFARRKRETEKVAFGHPEECTWGRKMHFSVCVETACTGVHSESLSFRKKNCKLYLNQMQLLVQLTWPSHLFFFEHKVCMETQWTGRWSTWIVFKMKCLFLSL